jgi:hypothetical protein
MKATPFEDSHRMLLHLLLVGLALLTYIINPDDIVWALVRHHSDSALLERLAFGIGTLVLLSSALLETRAGAYFQTGAVSSGPLLLSRFFLALALGLLMPLSGATILVLGETVLVVRLYVFDREKSALVRAPFSSAGPKWQEGFRKAAVKWGLVASMIVFTLTLKDRIAEIGAGISFLIGMALNPPHVRRVDER